ncbi:hypothetical protein GUJ93_ZPchr0006g44613 [Zizania palustris]|uniref:Secreted protein n=1 Tax=Zizania palustris TaxID=103762 RepID=A0A8J5TAP4_ZIZPA|nr:hypothetical protein GUJ93_ZPchr0006g44613 [Zizania palustris]
MFIMLFSLLFTEQAHPHDAPTATPTRRAALGTLHPPPQGTPHWVLHPHAAQAFRRRAADQEIPHQTSKAQDAPPRGLDARTRHPVWPGAARCATAQKRRGRAQRRPGDGSGPTTPRRSL